MPIRADFENVSMAPRVLDSLMKRPPHGRMLRNTASDHKTAAKGGATTSGNTQSGAVRPVLAFAGAGVAIAIVAALGAALLMPAAGLAAPAVVLGLMGAITILGAAGLRQSHPHGQMGAANLITLIRAGMIALVAGALCLPQGLGDQRTLGWALAGLVVLALLMDGIDGWLARRTGLASAFGARFDMEVDALLGAVLCVVAIQAGKAGLWLLPLGFMRYGWVVLGLALPWLTHQLPERVSRKAICVVQIGVLAVLISPALTPPWSTLIALFATAALIWSFAVDAVWLWWRR